MNLTDMRSKVGRRDRSWRKGQGQGSGNGTFAGRGCKGYHSRSGSGYRTWAESGQMPLYRRIPKRGFTNLSFSNTTVHLNLSDLARFEVGETVGLDTFKELGMLKGTFDVLRILGKGDFDIAITVQAHYFTAGARSKIEAAGGKCELIPLPGRRPKGVRKPREGKTGE